MIFSELLNLLMRIGSSIVSITAPMLEFLNNTATIGTFTFSYFELLVGGGLVYVLTYGVIKWIVNLD